MPTAPHNKKLNGKECDEAGDCQSGVCAWIVDTDGDLDKQVCCDSKSYSYNKARYLCDDRADKQTCYDTEWCQAGLSCDNYKCTDKKKPMLNCLTACYAEAQTTPNPSAAASLCMHLCGGPSNCEVTCRMPSVKTVLPKTCKCPYWME